MLRSMFQFECVTDDDDRKFLEVWHDRAENDWQLKLIGRVPDTLEMRQLIQSNLEMHPEIDTWLQPENWIERFLDD